jgi:ubiquinone/menaquinone biosynthesis C-methylase UbiE
MTSTFVPRDAEGYDAYMGRWSRRLAPLFLDFAGVGHGERVLDVGCGTGNLAFALAANTDIAAIEAIDYEEQFIEALRQRNTDPRITAQQGDACALPFPTGYFDRALSMLVLHFVSDAERAAAEMRRVVRPGGVGAACVWDLYGGMPTTRIFWNTVAAVEPAANERRAKTLLRPMTQPGELKDAFAKAGFVDITDTLLTIRMDFANFDDYWVPLMTGQGNLEEYVASMPERTSEQVQSGVRAAYLRNRSDGPRSFAGVALAIRGVVPGA